jgi:nucleotide-binding universal stress UspA family protein
LEITREVLRHGHDVVIMTAEGRCGFKEWLLGATSMHLMRKCPCPVWVVKPTQHERCARILAAVDTDPDDGSKDALNSTIMDLATSLAQLEQSVLHVVHVWALFGEQLLRDSGRVPANELAGWLREAQDRHQRALDRLLARYDLTKLEHRIHLRKGEAASSILETAREEQVDLIIMGTICRTGIAGFLIGNTAERILQQVDCSVLTVKPEGFVSPVTVSAHRQPQVDEVSDVGT